MENCVDYFHKKIKISNSFDPRMGLGVFADEDIDAGEIIEVCPLVELANREKYQYDKIILDYVHAAKCECEECKKHGRICCMVLGYGMIYNHQDEPNAEISMNRQKRYMEFKAIKNIKKGEEIYYKYNETVTFNNLKYK